MSIYVKDRTQTNKFNFEEYKKNLYQHLINRNKTESLPFENIIKNVNDLLAKNKKLVQTVELLERENNSLKRFGGGIGGDHNIPNEIQNKIFFLEKELNESIKEKNVNSTKLLEILTEKIQMKDEIDTLTKSNNNKQSRIFELEEIVKNQDDSIVKLKDDCSYLKKELNKYSAQYAILEENFNKKVIENHNLINEILKIKEDYAMKMNDMLELLEQAKKKKEAADLYFDEKESNLLKGVNETILNNKNTDFKIIVEDVIIPKKLKLKTKGHKKNITCLKFNSFGTNLISTGDDNFVKIWDATKSIETQVYTGFLGAVSSACYDHTESNLFAGSMDKTAKLWSLKNSKLLGNITAHIDYINCVNSYFSSPKGLTGSSDRTFKEWDFNTLKMIKNYSCISSCHSLAIANDDSFVISGHLDGTIKFWSSNEKPEKIFDLHDDKITSMEILKNENLMLSISKDYSIKLFDIRKMETIYSLDENNIPQFCESNITVSSDKKYFAVGSTKGTIYVFNTMNGKLEDSIDNKSPANITAIQWRPYHSQIFAADSSGTLSIWTTPN